MEVVCTHPNVAETVGILSREVSSVLGAPLLGGYSSHTCLRHLHTVSQLLHCLAQETGLGAPEDEFTLFQLGNTDQNTVTITVVNRSDIGLYVDTDDGGKVKATRDQQRWSRFTIDRFLPQTA